MPHPLSLHQLALMELDPLALIRTAHLAGFQKVCLFTQGMGGSGFTFPLVTPETRRETIAALRDTGIAINNIEVFAIHPEVDVAGYTATLELGAALGGKSATAIIVDPDAARAAENFAKLCELAGAFGIRPAIEFMAMSTVRSIGAAAAIGQAAGYTTGCVAIDALHLIRTGGSPADVAALDPAMIGSVQICDGPLVMPEDRHVHEAMEGRLLPGQGEFPLRAFVESLPKGIGISVETPNSALRAQHPDALSYARAMHRAATHIVGSAE